MTPLPPILMVLEPLAILATTFAFGLALQFFHK